MKKKRTIKKNLNHIGNFLETALKSCYCETDSNMIHIWKLWDNAIENPVAANARPAAFVKSTLIVHTTNSTWLQQLRFLKKDIILKINKFSGKELIKDIKFKIGPL